ncbi:MAG: dihydroorotase family protein [Candidatus Bathyarchaeota archaeon]|nr:dihydroorotase family protein [Candidatus Bathyarchaeota archaeon]
MIVDSVLVNAKAYLNKEIVDCSIAIEDGKIFKIGKEAQMPKADEKINLRNLLVLPGLIDAHVHLRDEGKSYKEDFYTGTAAAAAGGITTVLDMPNNAPVTMSAEALKNRMQIAEKKVLVNVGFYSEFPVNLHEVEAIVAQGAVAFKLFMACQIGGLNIDDDKALQEAFSKVGESSVPIAVHAEDKALLRANEEKLKQANRHDAAAFLKAHSEQVELKAVNRLLNINAQVNTRLHFCHMTTKEGLNAVIEAKKAGRNVTCEVTPQHLLLSNSDFERYGLMLIMVPPLRSRSHIEALWQGTVDGWVDILGSDHAPHTLEEKSASSVWDVKVGLPGLETTLPLMLTMVKKNRISLAHVIRLLSEKPAEIFNLKDRGRLGQGKKADLTVVDFKQRFKIDASRFHSKAKYSPFDGWEVQGKPVKTFVNGLLVMNEQEIVAKPGSGEVIRREHA